MERRRKALGLKKPGDTPEQNAVKSSRYTSKSDENYISNSESKNVTKGKSSQKSQPTGSVTPKHKTPISKMTTLKPESPCSPLQSPGAQVMFLSTIASPEIEVSWDWSCSQVPKDMLPPKRVKQVRDMKVQLPVLPTINMCARHRPPLQQQITEEENQQRLEYYKNILSMKTSESKSEASTDSTNNNLDDVSSRITKSFTTPKRPTTRSSSSSSSKEKDEDNSLFDDSANDFMLECSQAIEEKLKNGEIDMGPIVDIKICQSKRLHSPGADDASLQKKTCHGRVNLFPENSDSKEIYSAQKPLVNSNCHNINKKPQFSNQVQPASKSINNNHMKTSQNVCSERFQKSINITNNCVDKFRKPQNGNNVLSKNNHSSIKSQYPTTHVMRNQPDIEDCLTKQVKEVDRPKSNCITQDITSLLDDEFDLELSCLDVDSLCQSSDSKKPPTNCMTSSTTKLCTQQEIEAKRLAALQKLRMKKKR